MNTNNKPLVSVVTITYNHELYIEKAINGVFTNFVYGKLFKATKKLFTKLTEANHGFQGLINRSYVINIYKIMV